MHATWFVQLNIQHVDKQFQQLILVLIYLVLYSRMQIKNFTQVLPSGKYNVDTSGQSSFANPTLSAIKNWGVLTKSSQTFAMVLNKHFVKKIKFVIHFCQK